MTAFGLSPVLKHAWRVCWGWGRWMQLMHPTLTSMLAFELLLPWDGGDNHFRFIPCPKTRLACQLGFGGNEHG